MREFRLTMALQKDAQTIFNKRVHGVFVKRGNHYYVDMAERINFSRVDKVVLSIVFHHAFVGKVYIYNHHVNFAHMWSGMCCLRYAP